MVSKKNLILIGTLFLVTIFSLSIVLPIFINKSTTVSKMVEPSIKDFFHNDDISNKATKIKIFEKIDKNKILKLTNYNKIDSVKKLEYDEQNIGKELKEIVIDKITSDYKIKHNNLYLQLRYKIVDNDSLFVDLRWIDKQNLKFMCYDKSVIYLNFERKYDRQNYKFY